MNTSVSAPTETNQDNQLDKNAVTVVLDIRRYVITPLTRHIGKKVLQR